MSSATNNSLNKTILLLSSDPVVRSVFQDILDRAGYTVLAAGDLGSALERLKESAPDLLIIRSYVEGIPGFDAATFLRTKCPGLRVLMVGGLIDDDRLRDRMSLEGFEVFPQPFAASAFLEKVQDVFRKAR